jgi:hypothetical protein
VFSMHAQYINEFVILCFSLNTIDLFQVACMG